MRDAPLRIVLDLRERDRRRRSAERSAAKPQDAPATLAIANAGLVLASAFLPRLFHALDYVAPTESGDWAWTDLACQHRAVHLLQWLVDGRSDAPEPELPLNKLLCGLDPAEPVPVAIEPSDAELRMAGTLLATMRANWPPLAQSSNEALRETFLQRQGRLERTESGWSLQVETRVVDILLDQLRWGYSTLRHAWMEVPINVSWR
jgi:hypothetical protein